jgi:hypothetical protein
MADGARRKFSSDDFYQNFMRNSARLRALHKQEEVPPPHPLGRALTQATSLPPELERIAEDQRRLDSQVGT